MSQRFTGRARLFVRSKRTTVITGHVSMESMGAVHTTTDYAEGSTFAKLPPEDARAVNLLRKFGINFERVDISVGLKAKLLARFRGVAKTPTLLVQDRHMNRYEGVAAISEYVKETSLDGN